MITFNLSSFGTLMRTDRIETAGREKLVAEAERLADAIRDAAPEDQGHLRESVRVEPGEKPLTVYVVAGGTPETTKTTATGSFDEGLMLEYGTSRSAAQPFFHPTIERMRDTITANIGNAAGDAVKDQ